MPPKPTLIRPYYNPDPNPNSKSRADHSNDARQHPSLLHLSILLLTNTPPYTQSKPAKMSLWRTYTSLSPKTRLMLGGGLIAWAGIGMFVSDQAEAVFGFTPTKEDKERLKEALPRIREVGGK
jgi:hypothetical protein